MEPRLQRFHFLQGFVHGGNAVYRAEIGFHDVFDSNDYFRGIHVVPSSSWVKAST